MIRLSIPLRQALARLSLPLMIAAAFGIMLLGKADTLLAERLRTHLSDALSPIYAALAEPMGAVRVGGRGGAGARDPARGECALREENERLRRWHAAALALETENQMLRRQLNFLPEAAPAFVTAARWWPMAAAPMPGPCCSRRARSTASARARSRWTSAASSAG